ncbi:MAG: M16 family metallopeptidase [Hyphomonas sp.]
MKRPLAAGLFALLAFSAFAEEPGWAPATARLANGMDVVVLPDHRAPVVTHMVWYRVGSADEAPGKSGIAHLFEHVMFKQTRNIGPEEFTAIVQRSGRAAQRVHQLGLHGLFRAGRKIPAWQDDGA